MAVLAVAAWLLSSLSLLRAQQAEVSLDALRDLDGVGILVHALDEKLAMAGFQAAQLREVAESELKVAGIPVLNKGEEIPSGAPVIEIRLSAVIDPQGALYIFDLDFKLRRGSLVRRDQTRGSSDTGWRQHWNGIVPVNYLSDINDRLRNFMKEFTAAYRAVNHPRVKRGGKE